MDPEALSATLFKWDPRGMVGGGSGAPLPAPLPPYSLRPRELGLGGLEDLFQAYGIRYYTAAKIAELGFTVSTLLDMKDEELEDMMNSLSHIFRWDLLVGERYGIKAAVRAERRRLDDETDSSRRRHLLSNDNTTNVVLDALSQEGQIRLIFIFFYSLKHFCAPHNRNYNSTSWHFNTWKQLGLL